MNILVNLNNEVDVFQIKEEHKARFNNEFPQHDFKFVESYDEFKGELSWAESAVLWFFPEKLFAQAPKLKALYTPSAGKDWVAVDESGRVQTHFSSYHGYIISESFLAMLFYHSNHLAQAISNKETANWDRNAFGSRKLLSNKSILIVGYGNIGKICAEHCMALGISVTGACRDLNKDANCELRSVESLTDYIGEYDVILNLLPGGELTEKFISREIIDAMMPGVEFYNFGRGVTVDEDALIDALRRRHISFAGLDVYETEPLSEASALWELPNVLLTPHSSCCYEDYLHLFIDELKAKF